MLRRRPRQSRAIELCNRTEVKRKANTFCRCKTTIERKGIHTWLVDGKIRAVCCVANRCAIRQRIPIKQQRRLTGARLRRCGVCRQQLHIRTATGRTCRTRCTSRACGACYTSRACRTCCACYTGRTSWACWACWARYARRTCRSCWARYTGRAGWTGWACWARYTSRPCRACCPSFTGRTCCACRSCWTSRASRTTCRSGCSRWAGRAS